MRTPRLQIAFVLAALVLAGCGGGDNDKPSAERTLKFTPPTEKGVSSTIRDYLNALNKADGKRACRLLDDRGKASVISFLPSNRAGVSCEKAIRLVSRQVVPVRHFKIEKVAVSGRSATASVEATNPPYSSGVLLANRGDGWQISFPPGLLAKSGEKKPPEAVPGVPLERD